MCLSVFTGCSLVERDDKAFYESDVAYVTYKDGTKDTIKSQELITAYYSYGYNYVNNYGYTKDKAVSETLETIINKRITIKAVKDYYKEKNEDLFNAAEKTYLWDKTYEAVYDNLKSYYFEAIDHKEKESDSASSNETNKSVFSDYESSYELVEEGGKYVIKVKVPATTIRATYARKDGTTADFENEEDLQAMYDKLLALTKEGSSDYKQWNNGFKKYISAIDKNYEYKGFKNNEEKFKFELNRIYEILRDNYIVEKYETIYNEYKQQDSTLSGVTVKDVLNLYSKKVATDYTKYQQTLNGKTSFETDILSSTSSVDYIWQGENASNYFSVGYIKLNFKGDQSKEYSLINSKPYAKEEDKQADLNRVYDAVYATIRDAKTGKETDNTILAKDLLKEINTSIEAAGQYVENNDDLNREVSYAKAEAFRKYFYLYNDDDTLKGAETNTVFGVNNKGEVLANSTFSSNDAVKKAIKKLYNDGNAKVGDTTEIVKAEDGVYVFFYAGKVENLFEVSDNFDLQVSKEAIKTLRTTRTNIFSSKTIFDGLYDTLKSDNFSVFQNMDINKLRQNCGQEVIKNILDRVTKSL